MPADHYDEASVPLLLCGSVLKNDEPRPRPLCASKNQNTFEAATFLSGARMRRGIFLFALILCINDSAHGQQRPQVFRGARIIPIAGAPIETGVLVVHDGRITAVGAAGRVREPEDAVVHELAGKVIMPGLVDTHSHIGGGDGGDGAAAWHGDG